MKPTVFFVFWGLICSAMSSAAMASDITGVRFGEHPGHERIVIETRSPVEFETYTLADPVDRLVISFKSASWAVSSLQNGRGRGPNGLGVFRFDGQSTTPRLIFDLEHPFEVKSTMTLPPATGGYRTLIDVVRAEREQFAEVSGFPEQTATLESLIFEQAGVNFTPPSCEAVRVVIDPGHGGRDPGAVARFGGGHEKDVNLAAGLMLRDLLLETGRYEVIMTRDTDRFVELMDRVDIAQRAEADLFISLHADASPNSASPQGATVYSMNHRAVSRARNRAIRHGDWVDPNRPQEVSRILVEMSLTNKQSESERFAASLRSEIGTVAPLWRDDPMQANFAVLIDASVPAVLLEMGFLTNRIDSRRMNNRTEQRRLMQAAASAIDNQFAYCGGGQHREDLIADRGSSSATR